MASEYRRATTHRAYLPSTGAVVDLIDYDGFGEVGEGPGEPMSFSPPWYDPEDTALFDHRIRGRPPLPTGRWLDLDPVPFPAEDRAGQPAPHFPSPA